MIHTSALKAAEQLKVAVHVKVDLQGSGSVLLDALTEWRCTLPPPAGAETVVLLMVSVRIESNLNKPTSSAL